MRGRRYALCLMVLATLAVPACASASRVTYIPDGGSYAADGLLATLEASDAGAAADVTADDAPAVRQEALADLRTNGDDAARLADVLTSEFPTDVLAVPFAVERGTYEDEPAWIVFEAWGETGERLTHRRLWVFAEDDLSVLAAQSVR